jgi:cell division protein FtsL
MSKRTALLLLALMVSAMMVVDARQRSRVLFADLLALRAESDALNTEWGKLLLEEGAWSQHQRLERMARTHLKMNVPRSVDIVVTYLPPEILP